MKVRLVVPLGGAPGEPPSGGYRYDEALAAALRARGHDARVVEAPEPGAVHLFDGLGAARWAPRLAALPGVKVALLHQPAAVLHEVPPGEPRGPDARPATSAEASPGDRAAAGARAHAAEVALLSGCAAAHFVSARAERDARARHGALPPAWVAVPGVDHFTPVAARRERRLVAIGHLVPGKGALEALGVVAGLRGDWHLDWLGAPDVDAGYAARVGERVRALGLEGRVTFHGRASLDAVARALARASACLATSRYESWGLGLAEALRAGVPVVGDTPAGVLEYVGGIGARGGDVRAWLQRCLDGDALGEALRREAQAAGALLPTWAECAATTARHLEALCAA